MFNEKLDPGRKLWRLFPMHDKRLTKRLTGYWERLKGNASLPQWVRVNSGEIGDIWGQCCVWRIELPLSKAGVRHYTFEHTGEEVKKVLGMDLTGMMFMTGLREFSGARIMERLDEAVAGGLPLADEGVFVNERGQVVKYRSCLLPFGNARGGVSHVMLGLSWKAF